jgi:archaellum component FlaC
MMLKKAEEEDKTAELDVRVLKLEQEITLLKTLVEVMHEHITILTSKTEKMMQDYSRNRTLVWKRG